MRLSYFTGNWPDLSWDAHCELAESMGLQSLELCYSPTEARSILDGAERQQFLRHLGDRKLAVSCVTVSLPTDGGSRNTSLKNAADSILLASALHAPYVCLDMPAAGAEDEERCAGMISELLPLAESEGVILLVETKGVFSDTSRLCRLLDRFASDHLAALWNFLNPYALINESADRTIQNLGAYVKHVRVSDSETMGPDLRPCLVGEGVVPMAEMADALRSIDYSGTLSLDFTAGKDGLNDPDIVLPHYVNVISRFIKVRERGDKYFENKRGTGKFIWPKDELLELTFSQVLDRLCEEFPDQYAFRYTTLDYTRTYAEFREDVDRFARSLVAQGVKAGDKVAAWATNVPQWYIAFWATVKIGAVLVTVNTAYKIREAEYLLRQADVHTLVMIDGYRDSDYVSIVKELCPELEYTPSDKPLHCKRLPFLRHIVTVSSRQKGCLTWDEALALSDRVPVEEVHRRAALVRYDDVCNMQYTSGTTGFPKGVMLTHYNIVNNGKCIGDRMDLSTADRMMIHVPMFHCFGMVLAMTASMTHSVTMSPLPYFSPKSALTCIGQERITCFHGVPTMFIAMLEHKDFNPDDFSHMRTGIMAGSPCPVAVMRDVVEKMHMSEITIVFGQTEASPGCTMSSTDDPLDVRVATVGRALPQIECKIVDPETGEDLPDNVTGEFVARGYNIMKGYYKMPGATAAAIDKDGWLHTGDLACRTPEGNYRITGRLKDMIIRGGENIYPKEIEEFLYTHPKIKDVQVIGVPSAAYGEEIMASVILKDGAALTEQEVKDFVHASMAKHKVPSYVDFVAEFPMNAAGKILKYRMREDAVIKFGLQKAASIETA
ncbi:fatty-acyl-CoA synthase [Sporobacter termitidis DSM 10068]|uniref:Fatty-acyl-CoA synthase n=1 Tax=Sporobacter termitidis DSM 10068 TaxID=1123282 RepID=A0A1M5Z6P6_9FIRM|nr:AMP-binding protein [Sporobacter termitidis]SHI19871.1 fatty-acyl-CoA synthase [Sporobacter termitidis DSM 10068]